MSRWVAELSRVLNHAFRSIDHTLESLSSEIAKLSTAPLAWRVVEDGVLPSPHPNGQRILVIGSTGNAIPAFSWNGQWLRMSDGEPL